MRRKDDEEGFRLRIDYLKQSKDYEDFCKWQRRLRRDPAIPIPEIFMDHSSLNRRGVQFYINFSVFGDIHASTFSFAKWYKSFRSNPNIKTESFITVKDYSTEIAKDFDVCIANFKQTHHREPNLQEFKQSFLEMMAKTGLLYTRTWACFDRNGILEDFNKLLNQWKKKPTVKKQKLTFKTGPLTLSTNYLRWDELKRHLRIFNKFKTMSWKEIAETDESYSGHLPIETTRREIYTDKKKAEAIIKNVEEGIFPGNYQGVTARKY